MTTDKTLAGEIVVAEKTGASIQRAIDALAAAGGGRVVLDGGVYESGTLYLRSGIELHVAEGAVLRGAPTPEGYDDIDDPRIDKAPEKSKKVFIACLDGKDIAITGKGVIDGQGVGFYDGPIPEGQRFFSKPNRPRTRMIQFFKCSGVRLEDITLKDSPGWTCWFRMCEDIAITGVTVDGDQRMINNDGLDFDGCRRVSVRGCRLHTGDDCIVVRAIKSANGDSSLCEDVEVTDCDLDSACQAVRLGCPSDGTIRHVRFSKLRVRGHNGFLSFHPYRYLQHDSRGGFAMEDVVFDSCVMDVQGSPVFFDVEPGIELRDFGHVTFRNIKARGKQPISLKGNAESPLVDIRFENAKFAIADATPLAMNCACGISFTDTEIESGSGAPSTFDWNWKSESWEVV